jgi:hypothetical protein
MTRACSFLPFGPLSLCTYQVYPNTQGLKDGDCVSYGTDNGLLFPYPSHDVDFASVVALDLGFASVQLLKGQTYEPLTAIDSPSKLHQTRPRDKSEQLQHPQMSATGSIRISTIAFLVS